MAKKRNFKTWLAVAVILVGLAPAIAAGGVIYVDANAPPGGNGQTWGTAYKYLQDALAVAVDGNDIWVAEGIYRPDENTANPGGTGVRTTTFQLISGVAIYGGFPSGGGAWETRDPNQYETVLSGDLNGDDVGFANNGENSYHVVTGNGTDSTAVLDGFTITAGNANDINFPYNVGGGMSNDSGTPTITNCTFSGNSACWGGGMRNDYSSLTVTNCTFSGNWAHYASGGGMYNTRSWPVVINCTFSGNWADEGGGMANWESFPRLTNCTFRNNSADQRGGGMYNWTSSRPTVTNCILWGDSAPSGPEIYSDGTSPPTVTYSDIQGGWSGTGNINADPCFVDANGPDDIPGTEDDNLRLSAGSPCIDAGDNTAVTVTTDLDGNPRICGTSVDMGAYESPPIYIFVDGAATGANDGTSWANAFNYLQDAIAAADPCDEIWVAEGTYKPDANTASPGGTGDREASFQLMNGVEIYGGFVGDESSLDERDWRTNDTILSGDINTPDRDSDNSYHVVTSSGTDANTVLDGFTIRAGNANEPYPSTNGRGGGMYNDLGSPTVVNCTFSRNSAVDVGGGMSNYNNSGPTVMNCTFSGNSAAYDGGGMDNENSSPMVSNCAFIGNSATYSGGGISNYDSSSPTVTNCTFSGNSAGNEGGGGMYNEEYGSPTVSNCTFGGNSATNYGGGMYNEVTSSPTLTNCILWGNTAPNGPQIYNDSSPSSATVSYSDIEGSGGSGAGWDPNSGTDGGNNIDEDPLFIDPNGLDGIPNTADDEEGYVHLRGYSPCINAGDPGGDYSGQVDVDNQPRVAYGRVDMGADEVYPIAGDVEPDGDVDFGDFAYFAEHWLLGK